MKKEQRLVECLSELFREEIEIEKQIAALPCGYISVKKISGHVYNYRQWREGKKIISQYVPDAFLNGVKRKIAIRKEQEDILKAVKKDIKSASRKVLKAELLDEKGIKDLKAKIAKEIA